jgi:hypothetical protein
MKSKEEIDELYHKLYDISLDGEDNLHYYSFVDGYKQCQEDMAKNYTEREVVIMLQDCAIHFGIMNKSKDDGTFTTQINKWVKNKINKQD